MGLWRRMIEAQHGFTKPLRQGDVYLMSDSASVGDYPYSPNTTPINPWPMYPPQPQQTWVYPPFPTVDQLAAAKAYEAMEAYYERLWSKLDDRTCGCRGIRLQVCDTCQGVTADEKDVPVSFTTDVPEETR